MKEENLKEKSILIFWLFIIGSIIGYIYEIVIVLFQKGYFESRQGLIYGPFIPVYGFGVVVYYLVLKRINTKNKVTTFFITAVLGGITEYIFSFMQEKVFGTISWDYSYLIFNINGRTSLLHCTYWGIGGILYVKYIIPIIEKIKQKIDNMSLKIITTIFTLFMIFDISISWLAAERQMQRYDNIAPKNRIDVFLDSNYPDEYMDKIFANKKIVN